MKKIAFQRYWPRYTSSKLKSQDTWPVTVSGRSYFKKETTKLKWKTFSIALHSPGAISACQTVKIAGRKQQLTHVYGVRLQADKSSNKIKLVRVSYGFILKRKTPPLQPCQHQEQVTIIPLRLFIVSNNYFQGIRFHLPMQDIYQIS